MDVIIAEKPTIAYIIVSALGADKKEILCKGLKSSKGTTYDAYISYDGCEPHQYTNREGKEAVYYSIKCKFRFPERRNKRGKYSRKKKTESEGQV